MFVESWDSFLQQAEELYRADPLHTRYSIKYRHCEGKLVLKVTDNSTCLQYRTQHANDLKKVDRLNTLFLALMTTGKAPPAEATMEPANPAEKPARRKA